MRPSIPTAAGRRARDAKSGASPWRWRIGARTLWVVPDQACRVLSWAPLGGGVRIAHLLANHQIELDDREAMRRPRACLAAVVRAAGYDPQRTVALMTGAEVARAGYALAARAGVIAGAWCTVGFSNALRVGDRATVLSSHAGTINIIVVVNRPLIRAAMVEAVAIATEARALAVLEAGIESVRSGAPATGTGTDCIAIAAPLRADARAGRYCGKHTLLGELIGRAVLESCMRAIRRMR
ncbi:MAG TPA: adenosylcobinamide amidohydrolase [Candidatus Binataceae bacterium]|nr:adenosylcobinamide amidohydrolase [Candidatus Binataceae bacterium]